MCKEAVVAYFKPLSQHNAWRVQRRPREYSEEKDLRFRLVMANASRTLWCRVKLIGLTHSLMQILDPIVYICGYYVSMSNTTYDVLQISCNKQATTFLSRQISQLISADDCIADKHILCIAAGPKFMLSVIFTLLLSEHFLCRRRGKKSLFPWGRFIIKCLKLWENFTTLCTVSFR
jgi:hypothetical protein